MEDIIKLETAKLAQQKGYNKNSNYFYTDKNGNDICEIGEDGDVLRIYDSEFNHKDFEYDVNGDFWYDEHGNSINITKYSAPTQALLQKWLRIKFEIDIEITKLEDGYKNYVFKGIEDKTEQIVEFLNENGKGNRGKYVFSSYENALESALIRGLNLLEDERNG